MSILNRLIKNLFPENTPSSNGEKEVLLRETINPNQLFLKEYEKWIDGGMHHGLLTHLQESRLVDESDSSAEVNYFRHADPYSNGFYFHGEAPWTTKDYSFFVHYSIQRLKMIGYYLNNSRREVVEEDNQLKTVERFYLKPGLKYRRELPYEQLFGNILIEHRLFEEKTNLVKIMANVYSDRNFKKPYDFEDLLNRLLVF